MHHFPFTMISNLETNYILYASIKGYEYIILTPNFVIRKKIKMKEIVNKYVTQSLLTIINYLNNSHRIHIGRYLKLLKRLY